MTSWLIKQFEHNATRPVREWLTKQGNDRTWVLVLDEDTQCAEASLLHSFFSPSGSFWPADGRIRKTKKLISPFCSPLPPPTLVSWPALSSQPHSLAKTSIYVKQLFSPPQPSEASTFVCEHSWFSKLNYNGNIHHRDRITIWKQGVPFVHNITHLLQGLSVAT